MAFSLVQNMPDINVGVATTVTTKTFSTGVTSGNTVVGWASIGWPTVTAFSVVDNNSVTVQSVLLGKDTSSGNYYGMFWQTGTTGAPVSFTATFTGATAAGVAAWAEEWSGFGVGSTSEGNAAASVSNTTGANSMSSGSIMTTTAGDFIWSPAFANGGTPPTLTVGTVPAYTVNLNNNTTTIQHAYTSWLTQAAAGNISATWQASAADGNTSMIGILALTQGTPAPPAHHRLPLLGAGSVSMIGWRATLPAAAAWKFLRPGTVSRRSLLLGRR